MSDDLRRAAVDRLGSVVRRVLADGTIDDAEREELEGLYRQAVLTVSDVRCVIGRYLLTVQDDIMADGLVTEEERARCRAIVSELKIPAGLLSPQLKAIVGQPAG
jgi:uncharacterized tellurite resistance protein B-like protein